MNRIERNSDFYLPKIESPFQLFQFHRIQQEFQKISESQKSDFFQFNPEDDEETCIQKAFQYANELNQQSVFVPVDNGYWMMLDKYLALARSLIELQSDRNSQKTKKQTLNYLDSVEKRRSLALMRMEEREKDFLTQTWWTRIKRETYSEQPKKSVLRDKKASEKRAYLLDDEISELKANIDAQKLFFKNIL